MAIGKIHYVVIKKVNGKFIYFTYIILYYIVKKMQIKLTDLSILYH